MNANLQRSMAFYRTLGFTFGEPWDPDRYIIAFGSR